ncbi:hypothetical protein MC885_017867 [Smutsia gigantea]|nr:hypothetical protein MC885_017867 [Smutsia gigantea]
MRSMASPVLPKAGGIDRCHPVSMGGSSCPELTRGQAGGPTLSMCQWTVPVGVMDPPCLIPVPASMPGDRKHTVASQRPHGILPALPAPDPDSRSTGPFNTCLDPASTWGPGTLPCPQPSPSCVTSPPSSAPWALGAAWILVIPLGGLASAPIIRAGLCDPGQGRKRDGKWGTTGQPRSGPAALPSLLRRHLTLLTRARQAGKTRCLRAGASWCMPSGNSPLWTCSRPGQLSSEARQTDTRGLDTGTRGGTRQTQTCDRQAVRWRAGGLQTRVSPTERPQPEMVRGGSAAPVRRLMAGLQAAGLYAQEPLGSPQPPWPHMAPPMVRALTFTAGGPQVHRSSGSARSATCRRGDATHGSPLTGWCGAGPARPCDAGCVLANDVHVRIQDGPAERATRLPHSRVGLEIAVVDRLDELLRDLDDLLLPCCGDRAPGDLRPTPSSPGLSPTASPLQEGP